MSIGVSLKKFTDNIPNEDSCRIERDFIAISDGAGGCGVFANEWSKYLVDNLPNNTPITSYEELDKWVDGIWEPFFQNHEQIALKYDGIFQSKFYAEGSCATIAAIWRDGSKHCQWMSYGDSVVFHYNKKTGKLEHSFTSLVDFSKPPYLISCKDPMQAEGFRSGCFTIDDDSVVFVCSDALSHYVLMMYMVTDYDKYKQEIAAIVRNQSIDSTMIGIATSIDNINFYTDIILKLEDVVSSEEDFAKFMKELYKRGLIEIDDYTIVFLKCDDEKCNIH
jgi:hypothetical protein